MEPAITVAIIAALAGLASALVGAKSSRDAKTATLEAQAMMLSVKNHLLEFENTFVDRLNGRYIRKPDQPSDWPVTRREHQQAREDADKEHERLARAQEQIWTELNKLKEKV